jgi:hypothetical protein
VSARNVNPVAQICLITGLLAALKLITEQLLTLRPTPGF